MPSAKYRLCVDAATSLSQPDIDALSGAIERFRKEGMGDRQSEVAALDAMLAQIAADRAEVFELLGTPATPQTESEQTPTVDEKVRAATTVASAVHSRLRAGETISWNQLFAIADQAFGGTQAAGAYSVKDAYDAMEMGVNRYILERGSFYSPNATADSAQLTIGSLKHLLDKLPTQTKRTAEQDQFQQFSTPPAFAYAANWVANVRDGEVYLEPSAGLGGIAVFGRNAGAKVVLNELAPRRADMLEQVMPGARVFREDAEQIHNILPDDVQPTVVVMNPPFSSAGTRGVKDRNIGGAHIKQALARLAPGGRLVAIVGAGMSLDAPGYAGFWRDMRAKFDVRAAVPVEGTEYAKYGTTFGNVLLVIDKAPPQARNVVTERADTYNDLIRLLAGVRDDRPAAKPSPDRRPAERPAPVQAGGEPVRAVKAATGVRPATVEPGAVGAGEQPGQRDVGRSGRGSAGDGDGRPAGAVLEPAEPGAGTGDLFAGGGESGPVESGGSGTGGQPSPVTPDEPAAELTDSVFEAYRPQRLEIPGAKAHPGALVQSAAMASVQPPAATYKPNLPKTSITKGDISIAQLEAVVYAGQAHQQFAADGTRLGFFIGDGTGVGKGREIGAIILDNLRQGRKKAVWITEKQGLIKDARRDYGGVGGDPSILFNQNKAKADEAIEQPSGVLFTTYSTLRSAAVAQKAEGEEKPKAAPTRLEQLVKWLGADFDGVIAFDEAHNAGNAVPIKGDRGVSEPSAQAIAVVELQKQLPKARIVYVSATGATEVSNLSFANRLGLWGEGTPFESVQKFIDQMVAGGLATMELVARDMKQMGAYLARSLSFDDVTYGRVDHVLTPLQRDIYDRLAEGWQVTLQNMQKALEVTGAVSEKGKTLNKAAKRNAKSAYWGAQQRFFNQIITSMQMPTVVEQIRADLAAKRAVVLQLVNTNEAQQERSLAKRRNDDEEQTDLEDLDLTPRDQLLQMVQKAFPVVQYEKKVDDNGRAYSEPVKDSNGNLVENKEAVAMRDALLADLMQIRVPDGPLEILLNEFGPDAVAEITGRKQRVVRRRQNDGAVKAVLESRGSAAASADADAFMGDKKQILVFSDAGGTGFSFQADLGKKNQRKRSHYLLQPGWRANKAVQGLGRTHRTNQKSAPEYRLVSTDVPAHKRFLSSIARRLDQLGALTKGQRDTSSGGLFSEKDNLESKYATAAVKQLIDDVKRGQVPDTDFNEFLRQMGLEDIVDKDTGQIAEAKYPPTRQFLNRLLSLTLDMQERVFQAFIDRMEANVETAARMGTLDTGLQTIRALATRIMRRQTVHVDKRTGAQTEYVELELTQPTRIYQFPKAYKGEKAEWVVNKKSGRVWFKLASGSITRTNGSVETRYLLRGTNGHVYKGEREFDGDRYDTIDEDQARQMWDDETAKRPATYTERAHMLVGALLPIWDRLNTTQTMQVVRVQTDTGERLLGRQVMEHELAETMARLEVATEESETAPADVMRRILGGEVAELANGWRLGSARVSGQQRIELLLPRSHTSGPELVRRGAIEERIGWEYRYFVPQNERGQDLLAYIFETKPITVIGRVDGEGKVRRSNVQAGTATTKRGFSLEAKSTLDAKAMAALSEELAQAFPGLDWQRPTLNQQQGTIDVAGPWLDNDGAANLVKLNAIADKYDAPIVVRGHPKLGIAALRPFGFEPHLGGTDRFNRPRDAMPQYVRPGGGIGASTPLFGRTLVNPDREAKGRPTVDPQLPEMATAKGAARWMSKNAGEPWMREVAAKVLEGIDEDADIQYLEVGKSYSLPKSVAEVMRAGTFGVSEINTVTGKNRLYMKWAPDRPIAQEDLLHELLHAATQRALSSPKSAAARMELQSIRRALLANLRNLAASKSPTLSQAGRDAAEFFSKVIVNEDELLAYGLTSPTFREWATRMTKDGWFEGPKEGYSRDSAARMFDRATPEPELTLWERFVDVVRSLLGLSKMYAPRLASMMRQRERERIVFITQNSDQTLAQRLDELLREVVQVQRRVSKDEYVENWVPSEARAGQDAVDSDAFKAWFGDSKVVDKDGKPLVVYHGTTAVFSAFSEAKTGASIDSGFLGKGFYFSTDPRIASSYTSIGRPARENAPNVMPVYVSLQNPYQWGIKTTGVRGAVLNDSGLPRELRAAVYWRAGFRFDDHAEPDFGMEQPLSEALRDELMARGYDGVIADFPARDGVGIGDREIVAFRPEQIKSAIGNRGTFDPNNADIRAGTAEIRAGIRGFSQQGARNLLLDAMNEAGGIGTWAKTVGTQYAKAKQHPGTFGRVFDAVQDYIKDINVFANTAADQAPTILPKLEHWTDLKTKKPMKEHAADMKAAGAAIWKGTLEDKRVYKADELRKMGLNGDQIELYREFRATVDQSLDDLTRTEIMRLAGNDGLPVGPAVMGARSLQESASIMVEHLTALHEKTLKRDLLLAIELINDKAMKVERLKDEGYAPLMRFGRHTLHITDKEGATLFFGMYESAFEANRAKRELEADPEFAGASFTRGKQSQEAYRLFSGMPLDALELFAEATGNEDNAIYQEYLKLTKSNRSALKRMIHRQGIAGFSEDATRVLASFVTSNSRLASGNMHLGRAKSLANAIPKELGDLQTEATKLVLYVQDPQEEAAAIRGLLFTNFIGGSVASAAVNLTQPFTMSLPYLSQFGGVANAGRHLLAALRQVNKPEGEIAEALKRAEDDGVVSPQEIHHLQAEAMSRLGNHPFLKKAAFIWGSMFSLSEQFNRRLTFIAAYNTAKQNNVEDPFAFAEKAVIETQGLYNKGNKPNWARGAIGATVFTFKQYSIHYLEFLKRMWDSGPEGKKAVGVAIAILLLTAGASGLPFADDLDDAIDTLAQALGYDFSSKKAKRQFIAETLGLGKMAGEVATRGLSAIPGFPIDVSLRMGLGNLLPGTGALLRSNTDRARDVLEFAGAAGSLAKSVMDSGNKMLSGSPVDAALGVAPIAIQNIAKAMQMWNTGEYRNTRGQKVMNTDTVDAVMKGVGFQPAQIARESAAMGEVQRSVQLAKNVEGQIAEKWAQGLNDGDQAKVADARADLRAWNEKNPEAPMRITMQQVIQRVRQMRMSREQRAVRNAPREMRPAVEEAFR